MEANIENIRNVLGVNAKGIKFTGHQGNLKKGIKLRGFLSRVALDDLMHNFHVYINRQNDVVVMQIGRVKHN